MHFYAHSSPLPTCNILVETPCTELVLDVYQYFFDTYVSNQALFPPREWNQRDRVNQRLPRSDSSLEGEIYNTKLIQC